MGNLDKIQSIKERISDLPMPSIVATKLLAITQDQEHSLRDVVKIIETDVSMTTKVLKVANSAVFARGKVIETLSRAIMHLGEKLVLGIAIGSSTSAIFKKELDGYQSSSREYWNHSLLTAIASREVALNVKTNINLEVAFTAGLLHDIGKSVISEFIDASSEDIIELYDGKEGDYLYIEKHLIGKDHASVGYAMATYWNLPKTICEVIKHHHRPAEASPEFKPISYVVHLGDIIAMMAGIGTGIDTLSYKMDDDVDKYVKLKEKQFAGIILRVQDEFELARKIMLPPGEE